MEHPYVAATLGASVEAVNRRRFRADALVVNDLERYCDIDVKRGVANALRVQVTCLLYTSPSPRDATLSRMPSSA